MTHEETLEMIGRMQEHLAQITKQCDAFYEVAIAHGVPARAAAHPAHRISGLVSSLAHGLRKLDEDLKIKERRRVDPSHFG